VPPALHGFEFRRLLGRGTFGEVWLAWDRTLHCERAIKMLPLATVGSANVGELLAEGRLMARLPKHANRVQVHAAHETPDNFFLIMEYVRGGSLSGLTSRTRPMPWLQALRYTAGVAEALKDLQARGIVHRDVKPANIFWDQEHDEAVLGDFGIATYISLPRGRAWSPGYAAPELWTDPPSARSDVYALAATLYHLATGFAPQDKDGQLLPAWESWMPSDVRPVVLAGMEPDPVRRPDLFTFISLLRDARWQSLAERLARHFQGAMSAVRLQASVAVAPAHAPERSRSLTAEGVAATTLQTGDLVTLEVTANAPGHLTLLVLSSPSLPVVVLPRPSAPTNDILPGRPHRLTFRLAAPSGTERFLAVWTREDVRYTPTQWQRWIEWYGLGEPPAEEEEVRGAELVSSYVDEFPQGDQTAFVVAVTHAQP
jgi:serine/threonine protein kinase